MAIYRNRSIEKINAELKYTRNEIKNAQKTLERLEGKEMYLQSELNFNKELEKGNENAIENSSEKL